jgi:hypothetical protein
MNLVVRATSFQIYVFGIRISSAKSLISRQVIDASGFGFTCALVGGDPGYCCPDTRLSEVCKAIFALLEQENGITVVVVRFVPSKLLHYSSGNLYSISLVLSCCIVVGVFQCKTAWENDG